MHRIQPEQTTFARTLRGDGTEAERALWQRLRGRQLNGAKFRRQVALGPYVADLMCVEARLIVECDGGQHNGSTHDAERDAWLRAQGWRVLRFWNHEVLQNIEGVLFVIAEALSEAAAGQHSPSPQPSPWQGEGGHPEIRSPWQAEGGHPEIPSPYQGEGQGEG